MQGVIDAIQQFGFPIVAMVGLGYFVYYVWTNYYKSNTTSNKKYALYSD